MKTYKNILYWYTLSLTNSTNEWVSHITECSLISLRSLGRTHLFFNIPQVSLLFFGLSKRHTTSSSLQLLYADHIQNFITRPDLSYEQYIHVSNCLHDYLHLDITNTPPAQHVPNNLWPHPTSHIWNYSQCSPSQ